MKRIITYLLVLITVLFPALSCATDYTTMSDEELYAELEKIQSELARRDTDQSNIIFECDGVTLSYEDISMEYSSKHSKLIITVKAVNNGDKPINIYFDSGLIEPLR